LDNANFCGKATGILSVVENETAGTDIHRICNVCENQLFTPMVLGKIVLYQQRKHGRAVNTNMHITVH